LAYEQRPGDIAVFKDTEMKNEKSPLWKGTMIVPDDAKPGDKLEVAFWAKGDRGTMLAGSAKPSRSRGDQDAVKSHGGGSDEGFPRNDRNSVRQAGPDPFGDDIPFIRR